MGILNLLWKKDETDPLPKNNQTTPKTVGSIKTTSDFNIPSSQITPVGGVAKKEIVEYFEKVFKENNFPGPDYQEFKNALDDMKSQPLDEATKFKTLFLSFKSMGLTPQKLIETANQYKKLFATKLAGFDTELQNERNAQVVAKQQEAETVKQLNVKIDEDMRKLNEQKIANEAKIKSLGEEVQKNTSILNEHQNDWHATYDGIIKEIDTNIELINKYLVVETPTAK
jgi:hypothetical protein